MRVQRMEHMTSPVVGSRVRYEFARYDAPGSPGIQTRGAVVATVIGADGDDVVIEFPHWRTGRRTRRAVSPRRLTPCELA
jgi:hypothetical protein